MSSVKQVEFFDKIVSISECTAGRVVAVCGVDPFNKNQYTFAHIDGFASVEGKFRLVIKQNSRTFNVDPLGCVFEDF